MKKIMAEDDKIINMDEARLKLAPKGPQGPTNWLSKLPFETRFFASRRSSSDSTLLDFLVASDPTKLSYVILGYELNHRDGGFRAVDPVKFSRDYEFYCTVETKVEENDGIAMEVGGVEGDGKPEVIHSLHEE